MPEEEGYNSSQISLGLKKLFGMGGVAFLVIIIAALLVLNYFNVLSLSTLYPNLFGFLPHKSLPASLTDTSGAGEISVGCPVTNDLCYGGKKVEVEIEDSNETTSWLAFSLPNLVPVLAVFDGQLKREIIPLEEGSSFNLLTLASTNGKYHAQYLFISKTITTEDKGQIVDLGTVKKGESIGLVEGFPLTEDDEGNTLNLQFNISIVDSGTPLEIPLDNIENIVLP